MKHPTSTPESYYDLSELFFSTTNEKGIITSCNNVFARVSAYPPEEMIGKPHNLIRHADMPRAVFALLWRELKAGRPVAAYTVNEANNGLPYWVLAYVTPVTDGYLSVRLKPTTDYFAIARALYSELKEYERTHETSTKVRKQVIQESLQLLETRIREAGFSSYTEFIHTVVPAEFRHRREILQTRPRDPSQTARPLGTSLDPQLRKLRLACNRASKALGVIDDEIKNYASLATDLQMQGDAIMKLADSIQLFSLNAQIAATRLGEDGASLLAVAQLLNNYSASATPTINELSTDIEDTITSLSATGDIGFSSAVAQLQLEMMTTFISGVSETPSAQDLHALGDGVLGSSSTLIKDFEKLQARIKQVAAGVEKIRLIIRRLTALEVNGRVESSRITGGHEIELLFSDIGEQVRSASTILKYLDVENARTERMIPDLVAAIANLKTLLGACTSTSTDGGNYNRGDKDRNNDLNQAA